MPPLIASLGTVQKKCLPSGQFRAEQNTHPAESGAPYLVAV